MKALVTGATGFIGSRLVRRLVADGHDVAIVSRAGSSFAEISDLLPQLGVYVIDEGPESIRRAVAASMPDIVFHLATFFTRDHRVDELGRLVAANIAFPLAVVDAMAREGVRRLIDTGSAWQFFNSSGYRPVCLHSATKEAFTALLRYFIDSGSIDCIRLMMHDSYGPRDPRRKIFTILREHVGSQPLQMSAGEQLIDLVHVSDAVNAYVIAAERLLQPGRSAALETYSVSGGNPRPLREIVEAYLQYAGSTLPIVWGGRAYHEREVMHPWSDGESLPGWSPRVDIADGLAELAQSARTDDERAPQLVDAS